MLDCSNEEIYLLTALLKQLQVLFAWATIVGERSILRNCLKLRYLLKWCCLFGLFWKNSVLVTVTMTNCCDDWYFVPLHTNTIIAASLHFIVRFEWIPNCQQYTWFHHPTATNDTVATFCYHLIGWLKHVQIILWNVMML